MFFDVVIKGFKMRRVLIVGQVVFGVFFWRCDEEMSWYRFVFFVVFLGNVGSEIILVEIVEQWVF